MCMHAAYKRLNQVTFDLQYHKTVYIILILHYFKITTRWMCINTHATHGYQTDEKLISYVSWIIVLGVWSRL